MDHVRHQFERISKHLGYDQGFIYIKDALKDYPLELEKVLQSLDV